jgi:hypothetical protein
MMKRLPISTRRIAFVLFFMILPLTGLVCNQSPPRVLQNETATPSPSPLTSAGGNYSLQGSWAGNYSLPNGLITTTYGPDTVTIPLQAKGDTYVGSSAAVWHATATGMCTATGSPPVSFEVTATKGQFGDLDFSVERSIVWTWDTVCPGVSGSTSSKQTYTYTFTLPPNDGASKTFSLGGPVWTFVVKTQAP